MNKISLREERKMTSRTHFSWNCMNQWTKSRFKAVVTSYGRNKNRDDEIKKNQEKAKNSPSYRCAAIKKMFTIIASNFVREQLTILK